MADRRRRKPTKVNRRLAYRNTLSAWSDGWPGDDTGSAGVREPRPPTPPGPLAAAGELPVPEPPPVIDLPDPRL